MWPDGSTPLLTVGSALAVATALYPFLAPLAEIAWFSRMPADCIEEAVAIKQHLQVLDAYNGFAARSVHSVIKTQISARCNFGWSECKFSSTKVLLHHELRLYCAKMATGYVYTNCGQERQSQTPDTKLAAQERGPLMTRLWGEDAIVSWPNARHNIIDDRDIYMASNLAALANGKAFAR